jgi:glycerol-3-phosphate acyltransferase PlsX
MGADKGAGEIIKGGLQAARKYPDDINVVFVGQSEKIKDYLDGQENLPSNYSVEHADDEVPMSMTATEGVRMRGSSIRVGLQLVRDEKASAFISPGNTGAVMATSLLTLGRIEGVSRPAITSAFPTQTGRPTILLDCGANADGKPAHLSQFAVMGSVFASTMYNLDSPRVGLISIGEERSKGNELIFTATRMLQDSNINFIGNIEGRDILSGEVDVAVTDGFTGNIILKFAESIKPFLVTAMQRQIQTNIFSRVGAMLLLPFLRRMRGRFDYAESGGAPLLGVNGAVIICHGSSTAKAIENAVRLAWEMASRDTIRKTRDELVTSHFGNNNGPKDKSPDNRNGIVRSSPSTDQR